MRKSSLRSCGGAPMAASASASASSPRRPGGSRMARSSSWNGSPTHRAGGAPPSPGLGGRKASGVQFKEEIEDVCEFRKADPPRKVSDLPSVLSVAAPPASPLRRCGSGSELVRSPPAAGEAAPAGEPGAGLRARSGSLERASSTQMVEYLERAPEVAEAVERCRRAAMSIQRNVRLEDGVRAGIAVRGMREILRKLVADFRGELADACRRASVSDREEGNLVGCAEAFVMTEVSDRVFGICGRYARRRDERLARAATRLRSASGSGLGVREHHRPASVEPALAAFDGIGACGTPRDKALCVKRTIDALMEGVREQKRRDRARDRAPAPPGGGGAPLRELSGRVAAAVGGGGRDRIASSEWACSSDDVISLLLRVICQSRLTNLVAHVTHLCQFYDLLGGGGGEDAYNITTLAVATEYLLRQSGGADEARTTFKKGEREAAAA